MKNYQLVLTAVILTLSSCGINSRTAKSGLSDSAAHESDTAAVRPLYARMQIRDTIKAGDFIELKFTVYNDADSARRFCKWHTPFEPPLSKYLEIKDENGEEVAYQGAMAKRIMPPPASSYIMVKARDTASSVADLFKAYAFKKPSKYTIVYTAENISGLEVKDSVSFVYVQ